MSKIKISVEGINLLAELNDTVTAKAIIEALPFDGSANTWGDEIYFGIPVSVFQESDARAEVEVGELGYWPVGKAFCIFFGPTPASSDEKPVAASPVNIIGRVTGDVLQLKAVKDGAVVNVESAE
ncbi:cyclophilin-like fold protein [candidate division KSB1 bacterium]